ncbi:type I-E CRISPR-associated endoribonuclease Cas2e [Oceanithermus desulfurans]|uniref:Type I-E CRISPR-associated endoribonuclease Cas2 n=1 Tax=Oceanithermus desulfurans NBRC 100063 TaxID=1227550 RepID=A0A511RLU4_9DEIN|nr:type I-E CRISPR-associated endoribonuclease Cas2e [Oceanithermus desulfurans]GEM90628.1 type I-E CRISPR-associated endoribonuclease Cas2 [Oceanithermus desulfurans NBRC 100063]
MVVITLEKVSRSLRGELTRWLVELDTGVFVGRVSARVRELLWKKVVEKADEGRCTMAWNTANEQGFRIRIHGHEDRCVHTIDGVELVAVRNAKWKKVWNQHLRWLKRRGLVEGPVGDLDKKTLDPSEGSGR